MRTALRLAGGELGWREGEHPGRDSRPLTGGDVERLVATESAAELLPEGAAALDLVPADIAAGESAANPELRVAAENLAYVMYTSGSTGRPPGLRFRVRFCTNPCHTSTFQTLKQRLNIPNKQPMSPAAGGLPGPPGPISPVGGATAKIAHGR